MWLWRFGSCFLQLQVTQKPWIWSGTHKSRANASLLEDNILNLSLLWLTFLDWKWVWTRKQAIGRCWLCIHKLGCKNGCWIEHRSPLGDVQARWCPRSCGEQSQDLLSCFAHSPVSVDTPLMRITSITVFFSFFKFIAIRFLLRVFSILLNR